MLVDFWDYIFQIWLTVLLQWDQKPTLSILKQRDKPAEHILSYFCREDPASQVLEDVVLCCRRKPTGPHLDPLQQGEACCP